MNKNKADELDLQQEAPQQRMSLDDSRRVKVLSPGMLVFKRFIRNKLAVAGIFILAFMFVFSFFGPLFSSYRINQSFKKNEEENLSYATGVRNVDNWFTGDISAAARNEALRCIGSTKLGGSYILKAGQEFSFFVEGEQYTVKVINPDSNVPSFAVYNAEHIATVRQGELKYTTISDQDLLNVIRDHALNDSKQTEIEYNGSIITVQMDKVEKKYFMASDDPIAVASNRTLTPVNGRVQDLASNPQFMAGVNEALLSGVPSVEYEGKVYTLMKNGSDGHTLTYNDETIFDIDREYNYAKVDVKGEDSDVSEKIDFNLTLEDEGEFIEAMDEAMNADEHSFTYGDNTYSVEMNDTEIRVTDSDNSRVLSIVNHYHPARTKYDAYNQEVDFWYELESAIATGKPIFMFNNERFTLTRNEEDYTVNDPQGYEMLLVSEIAYGAELEGTDLTVDFVKKLSEAIRNGDSKFYFVNEYGNQIEATMSVNNNKYMVRTMRNTELLDTRSAPSTDHLLGTDIYGMDVMTRLMYGGRISLLVGFVVVFFEIILGVLVGGFSGYFGRTTDTILMRFVELFNCIPFYPMLLILGSLMEQQKLDDVPRLFATMAILGILSWTGIARIVRGQILSLREQDFMIATEATGIRTSRRIFRHLVPNVMPLLIVNATQSLGEIILTEATLGFLGLGVKYPMASWGSIVNQATDMQVMRTAWWIWIPAGLLILLTVLGFNFVGDGLRDAFDPKMKR